MNLIHREIIKSVFPSIMNKDKAKGDLKNEYKGSKRTISMNLQALWKSFDNLKMKKMKLSNHLWQGL